MVALEGLNFKFLALVFKFDLLNLNSIRAQASKDIGKSLHIKQEADKRLTLPQVFVARVRHLN